MLSADYHAEITYRGALTVDRRYRLTYRLVGALIDEEAA